MTEKLSLEELKIMQEEGDIDLERYKKCFEDFWRRKTILTDDQLLLCIGNFDDDYIDGDAALRIEAEERRIEELAEQKS